MRDLNQMLFLLYVFGSWNVNNKLFYLCDISHNWGLQHTTYTLGFNFMQLKF